MMKSNLYILTFIITGVMVICSGCILKNEKEVFNFSNDQISRTVFANPIGAGTIKVQTRCKITGNETLIFDEVPFFEFVINDRLVNSIETVWQFSGSTERIMKNKGTEFQLKFEIVKGSLTGLKVTVFQQFFPASATIREKIVIHTDHDKKFYLSKVNGKSHFVFPQYRFVNFLGENCQHTEIRIASWEEKQTTFGKTPRENHMYYPKINKSQPGKDTLLVKGPVNILSNGDISVLTLYEHASQDNTNGMFDEAKKGSGNRIVDAMQGTKGVFNFELQDKDFWFLGFENKIDEHSASVAVKALRGAYLDGEVIDAEHSYESVWTATTFYKGSDIEKGKALLRHYLLHQICENPVSRKPEFYYNTWGLQRNDPAKPLRGILTYNRIFEEIEYAAQLGVDIFVLDDGWEQTQGIWTPHETRLPQGLAPIKKRLDELGIKMGLWLSPMGIDSTTQRYKQHPEWVIKDSEGNPVKAQWGHPAFDFAGPFFDLFIDDCKKLIDQGCRFMKWDAINTFYSSLPGLHHGDSTHSEAERRARYEYLLPIYVTKAMQILTEYEPDLVIEIDLTEARRVMTGFAPLSQGKLFWMNNGASTYNDYSVYRTQSMRTIANEYAGLIPWELFTYASYPQDINGALLYNTHSALLAGHGFWGNLKLMNSAQRKKVGNWVTQSKPILKHLVDVNPIVSGKVGDSPEIYTIINADKGIGQIIGFSEKPMVFNHVTPIQPKKVLALLNHPYKTSPDSLYVQLKFNETPSSVAAFVLSNEQSGIHIQSSTVPITSAKLKNDNFVYEAKWPGKQIIYWDAKRNMPKITSDNVLDTKTMLSANNKYYRIEIKSTVNNQLINIKQ